MLEASPVPGKSNLLKLSCDVGHGPEKAIVVVTNASNVKSGSRIVVATLGAEVLPPTSSLLSSPVLACFCCWAALRQ